MKYTIQIGEASYIYEAETAEQIRDMVKATEQNESKLIINNYTIHGTNPDNAMEEVTKKLGDMYADN